ncbi:MAG: HD domain-containing protein [Candidatus Thorarchaeota archaeon]
MGLDSLEERKFSISMKRLNCIMDILFSKIRESSITNRDQPIEWSIKHMYSCAQLSKLLAQKRGFDIEIAGIAGVIHDLAIIKTGKFENHGSLGGPLVRDFLLEYNSRYGKEFGKIDKEDIDLIVNATINHTNKKYFDDSAFDELIKDVDSLDRFLHGLETFDYYLKRTKKALKDLNLDIDLF